MTDNAFKISSVISILQEWRERMPNVHCVSVFMFDDSFRIRVDWHGGANYTQFFTLSEWQEISFIPNFDKFLFEEIEKQYIVWETGEE